MSVHRELEQELIDVLDDVVASCVDGECRDLDWDDIVHVSDFHVAEAQRCQAKVAMPDEGFEPHIFNTFKTIALRSMQYVDRETSPTAAVSMYMRAERTNGAANDWIGTYLRSAGAAERVQTASRAVTWLARTIDVLETDDVSHMRWSQKVEWRFPGKGLRLNGKVDLVTGSASARVPHIVIPSRSAAHEARVAFLALLWALTNRSVPEHVVVLTHATGVRSRVAPEDLFHLGIEGARLAALALAQQGRGPDGLSRTPSFFTCQECDWSNDCAEWSAHQAAPPVRGGIRLVSP